MYTLRNITNSVSKNELLVVSQCRSWQIGLHLDREGVSSLAGRNEDTL